MKKQVIILVYFSVFNILYISIRKIGKFCHTMLKDITIIRFFSVSILLFCFYMLFSLLFYFPPLLCAKCIFLCYTISTVMTNAYVARINKPRIKFLKLIFPINLSHAFLNVKAHNAHIFKYSKIILILIILSYLGNKTNVLYCIYLSFNAVGYFGYCVSNRKK